MSTDDFDPTAYLDERDRIHGEASESGWEPGWTFQHWGEQNQNGDHAESILFDGRGEDMASGLPDGVGESIVDAHNHQPRLTKALRAVLELHQSVGVYDECDCTDEQKLAGHEDVCDVGITCNLWYRICDECCRHNGYQTESCADYHHHSLTQEHPCPTVAAITDALRADE